MTDASDEGEVMPNADSAGLLAVTGDGASDKHASDVESAARRVSDQELAHEAKSAEHWGVAGRTLTREQRLALDLRDARQREEGLQATNARLNRRCQESEKALGDLTKHPSVNQSRTGRMSYAVMSVAVRQANEQIEALNSRVAQLREALAQCCQSGHEIAGMAESFIWSRDVKSLTNYGSNVASLANAALSGTGTDWLEAHDAQVRAGARKELEEVLREVDACSPERDADGAPAGDGTYWLGHGCALRVWFALNPDKLPKANDVPDF